MLQNQTQQWNDRMNQVRQNNISNAVQQFGSGGGWSALGTGFNSLFNKQSPSPYIDNVVNRPSYSNYA